MVKYLVMLDNYPFAFCESKEKFLNETNLDKEELENIEFIEVKLGFIE